MCIRWLVDIVGAGAFVVVETSWDKARVLGLGDREDGSR
jgi:hypothetical protein